MLRIRRRSFFSPRPRKSSIPPISALGWCPDRSTIRIALLPPNSWSYHDDESRRRNVTVGRKNDDLRETNASPNVATTGWSAKDAGIRQAAPEQAHRIKRNQRGRETARKTVVTIMPINAPAVNTRTASLYGTCDGKS